MALYWDTSYDSRETRAAIARRRRERAVSALLVRLHRVSIDRALRDYRRCMAAFCAERKPVDTKDWGKP